MKKFTVPLLILVLVLLMSYFKYDLGAQDDSSKSNDNSFKISKLEPNEESSIYFVHVDIVDDYYPSEMKKYSQLTIEKLLGEKELQGFDKVVIKYFKPEENGYSTFEASCDNLENFTPESIQIVNDSRVICECAGVNSPDIEEVNTEYSNLIIKKRDLNSERKLITLEVEIVDDYLVPQLKEHAYKTIRKIMDYSEYNDFENAVIEYYLETDKDGRQVQFIARGKDIKYFSKDDLSLVTPERNYNGKVIPEEEVK